VQLTAPDPVEPVEVQIFPAGHAWHAVIDDAPSLGEYVPIGQTVYVALPNGQYEPVGHKYAIGFDEDEPAGQ